jgi:hypothetical protein
VHKAAERARPRHVQEDVVNRVTADDAELDFDIVAELQRPPLLWNDLGDLRCLAGSRSLDRRRTPGGAHNRNVRVRIQRADIVVELGGGPNLRGAAVRREQSLTAKAVRSAHLDVGRDVREVKGLWARKPVRNARDQSGGGCRSCR